MILSEEKTRTNEDTSDQFCKFISIEYPLASLEKKIGDSFFLFQDKEKNYFLFFCKIIESEIGFFREKIERESIGPIPITQHDHLEILMTLKKLNLKSCEYYVYSKNSCSIEKFRTIKFDPVFYDYFSKTERLKQLKGK